MHNQLLTYIWPVDAALAVFVLAWAVNDTWHITYRINKRLARMVKG